MCGKLEQVPELLYCRDLCAYLCWMYLVSSCSYFAVFASQSPPIQPSQVQPGILYLVYAFCLNTSKTVPSRSFLLCGGLKQRMDPQAGPMRSHTTHSVPTFLALLESLCMSLPVCQSANVSRCLDAYLSCDPRRTHYVRGHAAPRLTDGSPLASPDQRALCRRESQ